MGACAPVDGMMLRDPALLIARVLLVAIFPISGYYKIVQWPAIAGVVERAGLPFPTLLGMLGTGAELVLPALVVLGLWTRCAAAGLVVYVIAATYIGHPIRNVPPEVYFAQLMGIMKNLALIGGLLAIAAAGPGRWAIQPTKV
jgi:putative oxidoreductase